MSFSDLINATFVGKRNVRVGTVDGTPVFEEQEYQLRGWFDEPQGGRLDTMDRGTVVQTIDRRAVAMLESDAGFAKADEFVVVLDGAGGPMTGPDLGRWRVDVPRAVPQPGGISHWEIAVSQVSEGG